MASGTRRLYLQCTSSRLKWAHAHSPNRFLSYAYCDDGRGPGARVASSSVSGPGINARASADGADPAISSGCANPTRAAAAIAKLDRSLSAVTDPRSGRCRRATGVRSENEIRSGDRSGQAGQRTDSSQQRRNCHHRLHRLEEQRRDVRQFSRAWQAGDALG